MVPRLPRARSHASELRGIAAPDDARQRPHDAPAAFDLDTLNSEPSVDRQFVNETLT